MMKKIKVAGALLIIFFVKNVWADAVNNLKIRLDKSSSFYAVFTQKIMDSNGNILQEGQGDLWVQRPNLFNWHITQPYENVFISDGKTLWIYSPSVKQAISIWLKDIVNNTPFMLIVNNQASDWEKYSIRQTGDSFKLTPKNLSDNLKHLSININSRGIINKFDFVERNDQYSSYQFKSQKNKVIDPSKFIFIRPKDVTIDDQRR